MYDAILKNIRYSEYPITQALRDCYPDMPKGDTYRIAWGDIFEDKKGRFRDGENIRTSWIVGETDEYIQTRNTRYKKG